MTDPLNFAKFQAILENFANFQKFSYMKESGKMLEAKVNYKSMSRVHDDWLKLTFPIKRH